MSLKRFALEFMGLGFFGLIAFFFVLMGAGAILIGANQLVLGDFKLGSLFLGAGVMMTGTICYLAEKIRKGRQRP